MFTQNNTMNKLNLIAAAVLLSLSMNAHAGSVEAAVVVNPVGDFVAEFKDVDGSAYADGESYKADKFIIPWSKLSTGMNIRDKHAKDYFHADKYPNIEIATALGKGGNGVAKVKMNGEEKIVKGTYVKDGNNLIAEFPLKLSLFNVNNINFKGAGVQDEVKVKVTVPIKAKK
ncbi:YceI family protein [Bdellovibrio sp. qaytius]|nr:YceI family protein [Bdellovibrio sp. qaytius]